jgi:hypothetical protein
MNEEMQFYICINNDIRKIKKYQQVKWTDVNGRTDSIMAKGTLAKRQTMVNIALHKNLKTEQHESY